ncbi:MAG: DNA-processing protein DprA [Clostridiales bacterium]|jgi:DNA processing protein|nr:DNA-processing protein DprA [Clostridiales bacterium]
MYFNDDIGWIWLSKICSHTGPALSKLFTFFGCGSGKNEKIKELWEIKDISVVDDELFENFRFRESLLNEKLKIQAVRNYEDAVKLKINITNVFKSDYPALLKNTYMPPLVLYYFGQLPGDKNLLSVVGSRKTSAYGRCNTFRICRELAGAGLGIVSGMARGIDSKAHEGALEGGGYTAAVLGNSLDRVYPPENVRLFEQIKNKGCIISEYPPGSEIYKSNFPARNRIIAGISLGTFVTEAAKSSGAMITVDRALEENREIFALPGNVDSILSGGTNNLIKCGAYCVTSFTDIFETLHIVYKPRENMILELNDSEKKIVKCLKEGKYTIDEILEGPEEVNKILSTLTTLEIKGIVKRDYDNSWMLM